MKACSHIEHCLDAVWHREELGLVWFGSILNWSIIGDFYILLKILIIWLKFLRF